MIRRLATHLCALGALAYAARAYGDEGAWERVPVRPSRRGLPSLSIVVPARNEAAKIERCVRSLLAQRIDDVEVVVVDDRSVDATAAIVARLAAGDARLRLVDGAELPAGWVGKPWALHQGAAVAGGAWLLFTDADTVHAPRAAASSLRYALDAGVDALTLATAQELETFWERAVLPAILATILFAYGPLAALNDPRRPDHALANGQYLLVSRRAYDALGGHAALRGEIAEDVELAKRLKADGRFRLRLADGAHLVRTRMYASLPEIWDGFTKNAFLGAEGRLTGLVKGVAFCAALSLAPLALGALALRDRDPGGAVEAAGVVLCGAAAGARICGRLGIPRRYAAAHPLGLAVLGAIMVNAAARVLSGRGVTWRGRRYTGRYKGRRP